MAAISIQTAPIDRTRQHKSWRAIDCGGERSKGVAGDDRRQRQYDRLQHAAHHQIDHHLRRAGDLDAAPEQQGTAEADGDPGHERENKDRQQPQGLAFAVGERMGRPSRQAPAPQARAAKSSAAATGRSPRPALRSARACSPTAAMRALALRRADRTAVPTRLSARTARRRIFGRPDRRAEAYRPA